MAIQKIAQFFGVRTWCVRAFMVVMTVDIVLWFLNQAHDFVQNISGGV